MEGERGIGLLTCRGSRGRLYLVASAAGTPACSVREAPLQLHCQASTLGTGRGWAHCSLSSGEPPVLQRDPQGLDRSPSNPTLPAKLSLGVSPP